MHYFFVYLIVEHPPYPIQYLNVILIENQNSKTVVITFKEL